MQFSCITRIIFVVLFGSWCDEIWQDYEFLFAIFAFILQKGGEKKDKKGHIKVTRPITFATTKDDELTLAEYRLMNVVEKWIWSFYI